MQIQLQSKTQQKIPILKVYSSELTKRDAGTSGTSQMPLKRGIFPKYYFKNDMIFQLFVGFAHVNELRASWMKSRNVFLQVVNASDVIEYKNFEFEQDRVLKNRVRVFRVIWSKFPIEFEYQKSDFELFSSTINSKEIPVIIGPPLVKRCKILTKISLL